MEDLEKLVQEILDQGYLMSLATVDESGPWVSDVIYVADGINLYWLSEEKTRHSEAIIKNPKVAATITISNNQGEDNFGLQIEGIAQKLSGENDEMATKHLLKRKRPPVSGGFLKSGQSWFVMKPSKIEIINEPEWGYHKKELLLK